MRTITLTIVNYKRDNDSTTYSFTIAQDVSRDEAIRRTLLERHIPARNVVNVGWKKGTTQD
jgi:hypothetical protein